MFTVLWPTLNQTMSLSMCSYIFFCISGREVRSDHAGQMFRPGLETKKVSQTTGRDTNNDTTLCKFLIFFLFCGNMLQLYYRYLNAPRENKNRLETPETNTKKETAT